MKIQLSHITNKINRPKKKMSKVTGVVVHWTANEGKNAHAMANRNYFQNTTRAASCHLLVDDEMMVEALPWRKGVAEMAYHVGAKVYKSGILAKLKTTYPNDCTIGLEICVNSDGNFAQTYQNSVNVTAMMLKEHGLGAGQLYRHYDITGKNCPSFFVDNAYGKKYMNLTGASAWNKFVNDVANVLGGKKVESTPAPSTSTHIGTIKVLVDSLNVRKGSSFTAPISRQLVKGGVFKVYGSSNGLYNVGGGEWVSAGKEYVQYTAITKAKADEMYRVFVNGNQEAAFTIRVNAVEFANELHLDDPYDFVVVEDINGQVILRLQDKAKVIEIFRVRKSKDDGQTQKGAFNLLENAKRIADESPGYKVFDGSGKIVYTPEEVKVEPAPTPVPTPAPIPTPTPVVIPAHWNKIMGKSEATLEQMIYYVNQNCAQAPKDVARHFHEVGILEGVRGDVALAQALKETGNFNYGGDVKPEQNNFAGIGATGGVPGNSFASVREGVTAQVQHLKAYGSLESLKLDCVDPRFKYVSPRGKSIYVEDLAGKWAVPGYEKTKYGSLKSALDHKDGYGDQIMKIVGRMKNVTIPDMPIAEVPVIKEPKEELDVSLINKVMNLIFNLLTRKK